MLALERSSHRTSTESTLCNVPELVGHGLENEPVPSLSQTQAALDYIVSELIQEQWWSVRTDILADQLSLSRTLGTLDNLLGGPSSVLVDTNGGKMRCNHLQHLCLLRLGASLEQLLHHRVANVVYSEQHKQSS